MDLLLYFSGILLGWGLFGLSKHGDFIFSKKCRRNSYLFITVSMVILFILLKNY